MANQGKRMVKEYLIAEIGKESVTDVKVNGTSVVEDTVANITIEPAPTYTAGDNITIEEGVISATDTTYTAGTGIDITTGVISVNNTIATKDKVQSFEGTYNNTIVPTDSSTELKTFIDSLPVFKMQATTDIDTLPNEVKIDLNQDDMNANKCFLSGTFLIKDTANNVYTIISTANSKSTDYFNPSKTKTFKSFIGERVGNTGLLLPEARIGNYMVDDTNYTYNGATIKVVYVAVTRNEGTYTTFGANGQLQMSNLMRTTLDTTTASGSNIQPSNMPSVTAWPTTAGTYQLVVTVSAAGVVSYSWVAVA